MSSHDFIEETKNNVVIPAIKTETGYTVFCDCGEVIETQTLPKAVLCRVYEEEYEIELCEDLEEW